jgi:hypothetical protein
MNAGINLLYDMCLGFCTSLLLAPFLQTLDFKLQSRILTIDGTQDLPVVESVAEGALFFVKMRAANDGVHQVTLVLNQA